MTTVPPPQGMTELDYEAIEAAVTETVRGRWFLAEFARRNRLAETRQLLDAIARIEVAVATGQLANKAALPTADPSIRLLIQRIKEVAGQLGTVAFEMRENGVDERFVAAVDLQARAVAGMMRGGPPAKAALPPQEPKPSDPPPVPLVPKAPRLPRADLPPILAAPPPAAPRPSVASDDPRLDTLSGLDSMTLAKKLAFFS